MTEEERTEECKNCGRNTPVSDLNEEGRCATCGSATEQTPAQTEEEKETPKEG